MLWNFSPCVAQSVDPRWGRTYESYGPDLETITRLSTAYTKGLIDGGLVACAKHFFGDGNVVYGNGEAGDIICSSTAVTFSSVTTRSISSLMFIRLRSLPVFRLS